MNATSNLNLPYIAPAQAQKHVTHNEAIRMLDAVAQAGVLDRHLTSPPAAPAEGDRYIVAAAGGGAWAGRDHALAAWQDGAWAFYDPRPGWLVWVIDENALLVWDGASWAPASAGGGGGVTPASLGDGSHALVGVNGAGADATNRLSVRTQAALFDSVDAGEGGTGDCRIVVNKEAASDTASCLFQTGFSGRAEFGLTGDDGFHIKVSANGVDWTDAINIDQQNGNVGVGTKNPPCKFSIGVSSASPADAEMLLAGSTPQFFMEATGQATDQKLWDWLVLGSALRGRAVNDANSGAANWINVIRSGATISQVGFPSGGVVVGAPTGGSKGAGAVNAQAVYDDNALLSCYVFDQALDGVIDEKKWDDKVPDQIIPEEKDIDPETGEETVISVEKRRKRSHAPMRKFKSRIGESYDPLTLDGYARHWKEKRHLTSMPNEATFDPETGVSAGDWIQRLVETVEIQAVLIEQLNVKLKALET